MDKKKRMFVLIGVAGVTLAIAAVLMLRSGGGAEPLPETSEAVRQIAEEAQSVETPPPATPSSTGRIRKAAD